MESIFEPPEHDCFYKLILLFFKQKSNSFLEKIFFFSKISIFASVLLLLDVALQNKKCQIRFDVISIDFLTQMGYNKI